MLRGEFRNKINAVVNSFMLKEPKIINNESESNLCLGRNPKYRGNYIECKYLRFNRSLNLNP